MKRTATREHNTDEMYGFVVRAARQCVKGKYALAARIRRIAIRRIRAALRIQPSAVLWIMLGDAYVSTPHSKRCYQKALKLDPHNADAAYDLACIEFEENERKGDLKNAERLVDLFMRKPPENLEYQAFALAAEVYAALGRKTDAASARRRAARRWARISKVTVLEFDPDWNKADPLELADRRKARRKRRSSKRWQ
ncbi:MAG: hypothetical protein JXA69_16305 [Phycisphaerae bacterium]|nr:hypothetical protein [Phycisphaerae bacterium]